MGRKRVAPLFPIAVAPARAAKVLDIHRGKIDAAIRSGELRVREA
jgi:hypothetical protein